MALWPRCANTNLWNLGFFAAKEDWLSGDPQPRSPRLLIRMFTTMYRIIYRTFYHYSWHVLVDVNLFGAFRWLYLSVYSQLYRKTAACCRAEFLFDHPRRAPSAEARWMPMSLLGAQGSKGWGAFCLGKPWWLARDSSVSGDGNTINGFKGKLQETTIFHAKICGFQMFPVDFPLSQSIGTNRIHSLQK